MANAIEYPTKEVRKAEIPVHRRRLSPNFLPSKNSLETAQKLNVNLEAVIVNENGNILGRVSEVSFNDFIERMRKTRLSGFSALTGEIVKLYQQKSPEIVWDSQPSGQIMIQTRTVVKMYSRNLTASTSVENEKEKVGEVSEKVEAKSIKETFDKMLENTMAEDAVLTENARFNEEEIESREGIKYETVTSKSLSAGREFALKLGRAHRDLSMWEDSAFVAEYLEQFKNLPAYYEYRVAIRDVLKRIKRGEIQAPEKILSIASGPLQEFQAHAELIPLYEQSGLPLPKIYSLDLSLEMLKQGRSKQDQKKAETGEDIAHHEVVGKMEDLPIADSSFDMVEFSTLHGFNFDKEEDIRQLIKILESINKILKNGGVLRITHYRRIPDKFFEILKSAGWELITAPHSKLSLSHLSGTAQKYDKDAEEVILRKLKNNKEYILARKSSLPSETISDAQIKSVVTEEEGIKSFQAELEHGADIAEIKERALNLVLEEVYSKMSNYLNKNIGELESQLEERRGNRSDILRRLNENRKNARKIFEDVLKLKVAESAFRESEKIISGMEVLHDLSAKNVIYFRDSGDIKYIEQQKRFLEGQIEKIAERLLNKVKKDNVQISDNDLTQEAKRLVAGAPNSSALYGLLPLSELLEEARHLRMSVADHININSEGKPEYYSKPTSL
ncbi:MAG: hypothetical protein A3B91_04255 [Candidatus Yanofskybacteria bacterium RIFCSPHIGHO2_02_FULL_41_29]|uniref:Methyltransferase type 11 domain-containing protein n=1 Tax=Candidatus Yanofskybacteria bacterium RIFCSPHIGHO2_01_FULL_41_53 TaxID=1802663 RepID=A0A1F8EK31_9BACT|nr:MAG: hypothetical protein A2650_03515 [Candidatus Yanofskybacteria bacterium RIFCSPHIGHO2_01_FULL_41_53]OGN11736.1 MAG: hypothetical protein A3B91_04255 [Candidatus Yanofskybacteria bacterium RIFCSPHIGHO2_02_FULL_41_29]OGN17501.1 MAG: hypothetical protein A3F48_01815 [Candidatus Yanofskybacteria bacterium RIFCSPHIGHO2_12_FULL_41_9]OGN22890.1 MAG: hypothetical protein A2916_00710 [Candidatus Yanofskybacteria bacterium RIFCSPLOWO2_01_FULL_41_67]OGN30272.1 MAG: hypothetical protein A3H54_05110 